MREDAHRTHHLSAFNYPVLEVGRVANDQFSGSRLSPCFHSIRNTFSIIHHLYIRPIQHVSTPVHRRQSRKCLWQLSQTVQRINVRGSKAIIAHHRFIVQLNFQHCRLRGLHHVRVITLQRHRVPHKIYGHHIKSKLSVQLMHRHFGEVPAAPCGWVGGVVLLTVAQEFGSTAFFEKTHQWRF